MDNKLAVEVVLDDGYVYTAFVEDVRTHELEVSFEKNWQPPILIKLRKIRFPPEDCDVGLRVKDLVEVRQNDERRNVSYWRRAIYSELDLNTGRFVVQFCGLLTGAENIVVKPSDIRIINNKPPLEPYAIDKVEFEIPVNLRNIAMNPEVHAEFRKKVEADVCKFIPKKNILRLISKRGVLTRRRVSLMKNLHLTYLENELKHTTSSVDSKFCEEFEIEEDLMGLVLGKRYANVKEARKIKDVTSVKLIENTLRIQICGKTAEAVKIARNMVEYRKHKTNIPRDLAEKILEDDGKIIEEIVEQSGLVRIESGEDDESDENPNYPIIFVGTPSCIEDAEAFLDYQLKLVKRKLMKKETSVSETKPLFDPDLIVERVPMRIELKGLMIGKNFENVKNAEKIPGVVKIDIPTQKPLLMIYAKHEAAAKAARRLLEYDEDTVEVPSTSLGKIIGRSGITIKKIESLNKGVRVRIPSKLEPKDLTEDGKVIIRVCGPAHSVPATIDLIKKVELFGHL